MGSLKPTGRAVLWAGRMSRTLLFVSVSLCWLAGCGDGVELPSTARLMAFEDAGPSGPAVDLDRLVQARLDSEPYRLVRGDVLQVQMPQMIEAPQSLETGVTAQGRETYVCRISDSGTITLPIAGQLSVAGQSLAQVESAILAAYHPRYVRTQFPVYASVLEYNTCRVSVVGAVTRPGIYALRHDQMSLVALLMEAGGIVEKGAAVIRITRVDQSRRTSRLDMPAHADLRESTQGTRQIAAAQAVTADRSTYVVEDGDLRIAFRREGPLSTTGWLTLQEGDQTLAHTWLDMRNELRRHAFVTAAAGKSQRVETGPLATKLSRLSRLLESDSQAGRARWAAADTDWTAVGAANLVASVGRPPASQRPPVGIGGAAPGPMTDPDGTVTVTLPVRGLNIPFADVALQDGDAIVVERPSEQYISVVGLVGRPGNFPYPPDAHYTLIQAIAFAGGLDLTADPRYVSIYRLKPTGEVASAVFQLVNPKDAENLTQALALPLRPGDVVSVEHTLRTRTNIFLDRIFRISLGLYIRPESMWTND